MEATAGRRPDGGAQRSNAPPKFTVFLIEDDLIDKNDIMRALARSPYVHTVHWFRTGEELLEHFTDNGYCGGESLACRAPTLILLDLHIPGIDGLELLQQLKDHPYTSVIPVIVVSGDLSRESTATAMRLKANAYVSKPVHLDHIHEVMTTGWGWPIYHPDKAPLI